MPKQRTVSHSGIWSRRSLQIKSIMPADVARSRCRWITNCQNKGIGGDESKGVALTEAQHHPIKRKPLDHIKTSTHHYRQDKLWQRSLSEELDLTMFSDLSSFSQTNPGLCVTFDCFACFPLFFQAADTERYTCHIHYDVYMALCWCLGFLLFTARCVAYLSLRILCVTGCINQSYNGRQCHWNLDINGWQSIDWPASLC